MRGNSVERGSLQVKTWRMRIARWIPKATNTHSDYVMLIAFSTATMVARTRLNITLHEQCLSCLKLSAVCTKIFTSNKRMWGEQS